MIASKIVPRVSIIIPTLHVRRPKNPKYFLAKRYTLEDVLRDLERNIEIPTEVIVICNGSDPALKDFVTRHTFIDKYAINSVNVGVARAWNMGAMMAEGEVLCFLNDDVAVGPNAIEVLYQALMRDPLIGQVGPKGAKWVGGRHDRFVGETSIEDADAISGFLFLMRANLFFEIGGFDVNYTPAGFEEIDMSFAIRHRGYRCIVIPGLHVRHHFRHGISASSAEIQYLGKSISAREVHERNRSYFVRKWGIDSHSSAIK